MLGVEGYGSDSDNGSDNESTAISQAQSVSKPSSSSLASRLPPPAKKSTFSLPPPKGSSSSSGLSLPPPKKKAPKKILVGLPEFSKDDDDAEADRPPAKKPRLEGGAGLSGLLAMLPAPKNANPIPAPAERVLGGGRGPGLVFRTQAPPARKATVEDAEDDEEQEDTISRTSGTPSGDAVLEEVNVDKKPASASIPFLPPSLVKGRANVSTEDRPNAPRAAPTFIAAPKIAPAPAIDFFGLGSSSTPSSSRITPSSSRSTSTTPLPPTISSAPEITTFTPPEPSPQDPYPGYYQLPSGAWAAHDAAYYKTFYDKWTKEYNNHVRRLEKGLDMEKGFEGVETEGAQEVDAAAEMERAKVEIKDREERKALTAGVTDNNVAPKMNIKGAALGGRARSRHQLSTLLTEAYSNREELEEKLAQGRRNRKEAGNKYGF